jgi:hypothetical protein
LGLVGAADKESDMARRRSRAARPSLVAGIGWYDAAQWAKLKQVAQDAAELDESHEAWQRNAERTERELSRRGLLIRRVPIDVDALVAWCQARNKPVNGASRAEYTSEVVSGLEPT